MSIEDTQKPTRASRRLAGATVLQVVTAMQDDATGRAAFDLATASLRAGTRALVAGGPGALVGELQASGGEWTRLDFTKSGIMARRRNVQALEDLIRAENVAVVHAHGALASAVAVAAAKRSRVRIVTAYQGASAGALMRNDAQVLGDRVIALSHFAAEQIAERHKIAADKIAVIPPMVDTNWYDPGYVNRDRIAAAREGWRVRPEAQVILLPGRLVESQGHFTLIDAARILVNGGMRGVVFVIAGEAGADSDYAEALDNHITLQGLAPIFRRVGRSADMAAAYAGCDIVVLPFAHADVFSARAVEAQAMGRPVVASAMGAMDEAVVAVEGERRTGWLVPPHDELALARALAAAISLEPQARQRLAVNARAFTVATFSPQHVTGATLAVYEQLLQESD